MLNMYILSSPTWYKKDTYSRAEVEKLYIILGFTIVQKCVIKISSKFTSAFYCIVLTMYVKCHSDESKYTL